MPSVDDEKLNNIIIKNPISQHINGSGGAFRVENVEKQKTFNIAEWRTLSERSENQPPAKRGERRKGRPSITSGHSKKKNLPSRLDAEVDSSEFTRERCLELERIYWKTLTYNSTMYGADMPGSLFDDSTSSWNVSKLDDMLNTLPVKIPGVNSAYLYCGMWKSTFAWHLEDMDLYSINYIHFGAPKLWYSISQEDKDKFFEVMCDLWPEEFKNCREFLRHKTFHASPSLLQSHGIRVNRLIHYEHEFVLTFPYGYHSGFNFGYNCAESVNFATQDWLPLGKLAKQCQCISDSVGIDVVGLFLKTELENVPSELSDEPKATIVRKRKRHPVSEDNTASPIVLTQSPLCALCPSHNDLPLIHSKSDTTVHRLCALYIPETYSEINYVGEEILCGLENIPKARWLLKCAYCGSAEGACIQCSCTGCARSFHATCVQPAGVTLFTEEIASGPKLRFLCRSHQARSISQQAKRLNLKNAYSLLPGDSVQFQFYPGRLWSGVVQQNNISEQSALVALAPLLQDVLEVSWEKIFIPGIIVNESSKKLKCATQMLDLESSRPLETVFEHFKCDWNPTQLRLPPVDLASELMFYNPNISSDTVAYFY